MFTSLTVVASWLALICYPGAYRGTLEAFRPVNDFKSQTFHFGGLGGYKYSECIPQNFKTTRLGKTKTIGDLKALLTKSQIVIQVNATRITVKDRENINNALAKFIKGEEGFTDPSIKVQMAKNTLMEKALEGTEFVELTPSLKGTNIYIFVYDDKVVPEVIGIINGLRKGDKSVRRHFKYSAAIYAHTMIPMQQVQNLEFLGSREALVARFASLLQGSIQGLAAAVNSVSSSLASVLGQVCKRDADTCDKE